MSGKAYFLVLSSGYCGSLWLAAQLDKHPDISCTCNGFGLALPHDSGRDFSTVDPAAWTQLYRDLDIGTPEKLLTRVESRKEARVVGDVHGFRVETYLEAVKSEAHRPATVMHLVRHPITLLERMTLENSHRYQSFPRIAQCMQQNLQKSAKTLGKFFFDLPIDFNTLRFISFFYAVWDLIRVFQEIHATPDLPLVQFESVISFPKIFSDLTKILSSGLVEADKTYLVNVFSQESLENSGRYRRSAVTHRTSAAEQYGKWSPGEQEVFRRLRESYALDELYAKAGYDFFLGDNSDTRQ